MSSDKLLDAIRTVMDDKAMRKKFPKGMSPIDVLSEIRKKDKDAFPFCTVIDVADEMRSFYGPPTGKPE